MITHLELTREFGPDQATLTLPGRLRPPVVPGQTAGTQHGFAAAVADYVSGRYLPRPQRLQHWLDIGRQALAMPLLPFVMG